MLSAIFKFAKQHGVIDGIDPIQDAGIPRRTKKAAPTHATAPQEFLAMLDTLVGAARLAVALIYFTGPRPGEARSLGGL